jgi:hypothetical protein
MRTILSVAFIAGALFGLAAPALAEHNGQTSARDSVDLNLDVKIGRDGFRLGGTVFGLEGVYGAWINGAVRPEGFSVDGRVQHPERAFNFKLNADVGEWLRRSLRQFAPLGFPGPGDGI